jgi:hypothetical protein
LFQRGDNKEWNSDGVECEQNLHETQRPYYGEKVTRRQSRENEGHQHSTGNSYFRLCKKQKVRICIWIDLFKSDLLVSWIIKMIEEKVSKLSKYCGL